ncbi:hypothetical protein Hamer_G019730 [Homarus americanus]|uniref:C2H2-type domain-containing protein n=1 Tax=Homarus americanus TaxID=6706 RepID=A0A8J5KEU6_HOMAM|nr:hypothetical protein Hamer_G019730 [Homarus americanus]
MVVVGGVGVLALVQRGILWAASRPSAGQGVRVVLSFAERKIGAGWEPHPSHCTCESCRSCGFCGKAFSTVGSRKRHERDKHVDPGSLPCEVCGKWCKNRGALIKHKSMLHRPLLATDLRYETHPALLLAAHSATHHHHSSFSTHHHHTTPLPPTTTTTTSSLPPVSVTTITSADSEGESPLGGMGGDIQRAYQQFM